MEQRIASEIRRRRRVDVFLRRDFEDVGNYDQVGRALRALTKRGNLIRLGQGIYGRAAPSVLDGKPALVKGIQRMTEEALGRLGVKTSLSSLATAYNEGRTTQVPSGRVVAVDKRVRRKIGVNGAYMNFERATAHAKRA